MLVARVIGDCPGCGEAQCFGNVLVTREYVLRGCGKCSYKIHYPLPPLSPKKVLYLDQNFFSAAFLNKIDPTKGQPKIVKLMERIKFLAASQLLTVPLSCIHELETRQWERRKEAHDFFKVTSRGHQFYRDYKVEQAQVLKAFRYWLAGQDSAYAIDQIEALTDKVHDWDGYFFVDIEHDRGDGSEERARKIGSAENLVALFEGWRGEISTFEKDFLGELEGQAKIYLKAHYEWFMEAVQGNIDVLLSTPIVEHMRRQLAEETSLESGLLACRKFFASEHFAKVPLHSITCRTHAALKHEVMHGAYVQRDKALKKLRGYYTDLDHIAHYAPYCDAIAIDNAMAELMKKPDVALSETYGVKVFSLNTVEAFHAWLDEIEASMTDEHHEALTAVYGNKGQAE